MAISFVELIKDVENANKTGFKQGKGWLPHKSAEGGTRTIAYGHKLSDQEEKGGYVELPNGDIVEFSDRGLTDEEAEMLLNSDISKARRVAAKQWNGAQDVEFDSLSPLHQNLLSEIVFNIGSLRSSSGSFGWPSLAEGIKNNDTEVIKEELMRSFTTPSGQKRKLTRRVDKIREYVDNPDLDADIMMPDEAQPQAPEIEPTGFLDNLTEILKRRLQSEQSESQTPSEGDTRPEEQQGGTQSLIRSLADGIKARRQGNEERLERTANEAKLEAEVREAEAVVNPTDRLVRALSKSEVIKSRVYDRSNINVPSQEPEEEGLAGGRDDSKDPIFGIF